MKTCVSYFGNKIPSHAKEDFINIKEHNCDSIILTFSEEDAMYYHKTFIKITEIAHEIGLEVYIDPWGVARIFAGEAFSNFINLHPQTRQVLQTNRSAPAACPNNHKTVEFFKEWIDKALECKPEGIFWDEPHLYLDWEGIGDNSLACFCEVCQEKFYSKYKYPLPKRTFKISDNISEKNLAIYEITPEVQQFRYDTMTDFLSTLTKYAKSKYKNIKNIVCFLSTFDEKAATDWNSIAAIPEVDILSTSAYYLLGNRPISYITQTVQKIFSVADKYNKPVQLWIQLFGIPKEKTEEVRTAIQIAKDAGIKNIAVWGYKACEYMSHFSTDEPQKIWDTIVKEEFKKFL